ncbi:hypothetical protein RvY_07465 [Ramazzottius varieornatus]|uniref:Chitin-binding type-2 domain-containing protein n=1 Tax=Ramazzottius varieornatus TaxID=947166 RepID=A0A1D1V2A5_RAMVA|nr:hypothetical protein RvY_07465 [Ramazzottius varieornatus]
MNRMVVTIFFCVVAASPAFTQDASPSPESTTTGPSATTANTTLSASGSALNGSASSVPRENGSTAPPTRTQDQSSTTATSGSSDQGALSGTSAGSADHQKGSSNSTSPGQSEITTESSSSTTASSREESSTDSTTTESGSQFSGESSIGSSSDTTETSNNATSSQTRNREGDQQTQGSSNQVGAQGRALDNNGAGATPSSQSSTTPRRNNVASASANNNRFTSRLTSNPNVVPGNFGPIQTNAQWAPITEMNVQAPSVWEALGQLRGYNKGRNVQDPLDSVQAYDLISTAQAGSDYPNFSTIPTTGFSCEQVGQPGFYADTEARCQVIRRCDINAIETSYLCPNMTVFNQITLVCDWFFNVDCAQSSNFYDYSNRRLYHGADWVLLSDEELQSGQNRAANAATTRDPLLEI